MRTPFFPFQSNQKPFNIQPSCSHLAEASLSNEASLHHINTSASLYHLSSLLLLLRIYTLWYQKLCSLFLLSYHSLTQLFSLAFYGLHSYLSSNSLKIVFTFTISIIFILTNQQSNNTNFNNYYKLNSYHYTKTTCKS